MPDTSNLNFLPNQTVPNLVVVGLSAGQIAIRNAFGSAHVIVDVMGWFSSGFEPLTPARVADTRLGQCGAVLAAGETREVAVAGIGGVPANGAGAVALNLTVTQPATGGFFSVWPAGSAFPGTSNLNFVPNQTVANLVVVGVGAAGHVAIKNSSASTAHVHRRPHGLVRRIVQLCRHRHLQHDPPPPPPPNRSHQGAVDLGGEQQPRPAHRHLCDVQGDAVPELPRRHLRPGQNARAASFPSLPNYIAGTSGDYWGIADDALPAKHPLNVPNLFLQLPPGRRSFAESMTKNCQLDDGAKTDINGAGFYTARRTALPYYTERQVAVPAVPGAHGTQPPGRHRHGAARLLRGRAGHVQQLPQGRHRRGRLPVRPR